MLPQVASRSAPEARIRAPGGGVEMEEVHVASGGRTPALGAAAAATEVIAAGPSGVSYQKKTQALQPISAPSHQKSLSGGGEAIAQVLVLENTQFERLARLLSNQPGGAPLPPIPQSGLGNPGPLGLAAFALTTFCLSVFNTRAFTDPKYEGVVLAVAFFYGGIAQVGATNSIVVGISMGVWLLNGCFLQ